MHPQRVDVVTAADDVNAVARPGGVVGEGQLLHPFGQRIDLDQRQVHVGVALQHPAAQPQVRHVFVVVAAVGHDGAVVADGKDDIHGLVIADDVGAGDEKTTGAVEEPSGPLAGVGGMHPGDAAERAAVDLGAG